MRLRLRLSVGLFFIPMLLVSCGKPVQPIPSGVQDVTGIVKPAEISLTRRGTHMLIVGGQTLYYLESSVINLSRYEGREVELQGTVEANTDPTDTPVLVVTKVTGGPSALTRTWSIDSLGITIDTPSEWRGKVMGKDAQFSTGSGASSPILTLFLEGEDKLRVPAESGSSVTESHIVLGQHQVLRLLNAENGNERDEIDLRPGINDPKADVLTILFTPTEEAGIDANAWDALKSDILQSIAFAADKSSSSRSSSSLSPVTGSGAGMPCGGSAGILCPQGMRCEITDPTSNVGRCEPF